MVGIYAAKLPEALKGAPPVVVLLWGDDAGMIRQAAVQVKTAVAGQTGLDLTDPFAVEVFSMGDVLAEPTRLGDAAMTLSFTAPHRLITLGGISGTEPTKDFKELTETLLAVFKLPLQGVTLLLPMPGHLDKKHALVKAVEAHPKGLAVRFFNDTGRDLSGFIQNELKNLGASASAAAVQLLVANLGADREIARRELEKLVCYAGDESPITPAHVQASLCGATPTGVFLLAEAVLTQNLAQLDAQLHTLLEQGEDLNGALMMTVGELNKVAHGKTLKAAGETDEAILSQCGKGMVPPAAKQAFITAVRNYPPARLAQVQERTIEVLSHARSGLMPPEHVLARALLSLGV